MNRPQRQRAQAERFRPNNQPLLQRRQPAQPQQQPVQQQQAQPPAQQPAQPPAQPARRARQPRRELDLTLTREQKNMYDMSDPDSEFYNTYFDKPNDNITQRLEALDYSGKKFNTVALQSGITNYDLKDIDTIQLKPVSFAKFKAGDYQNAKSKSDAKLYEGRVRGFTTKYTSFNGNDYKGNDDLTWIVRKNRLLFCEILEKYIPTNQSNANIINDVTVMMRIMYLALGSKQHALYLKYAYIMKDLLTDSKEMEGENEFNEVELKRGGYIPWETVLERQKQLEDAFNQMRNKDTKEGYALNQDLLLLSLYCLIPPLRNEPKQLSFTDEDHVEKDWIYMKLDGSVVLDLNTEKKKHKSIVLKLPEQLEKIIKESYRLYPRVPAYTDTLAYPNKIDKAASLSTMNQRLEKLFRGYKNQDDVQYKVGASMLRSSYVNYRYDIKRINRHLKWNEKEDMAEKMRTSVKMMELQYLKIMPDVMQAVVLPEWENEVVNGVAEPVRGRNGRNQNVPPTAGRQPVMIVKRRCGPQAEHDRQQNDAYKKALESKREYYESHKEKVLDQQKLYRKTPERKKADARRKIINMLNKSPEYRRAVRQTTINKYEIRQLNGVYI